MNKVYIATLSKKELELIEKLIMKHGKVVDFNMIYKELGQNKRKQEINNFILNLVRKGWLVRIKKGVFVISDISERGSVGLSQLAIAQIINHDSYLSFEAALQYHGFFDQYLRTIVSVGKKRMSIKKFSDWTFKYIKVKNKLFTDFKEYNIDGQLIKIASKEKALIDFLIYRRNIHNIDLIIEKMKNYKDDFSKNELIEISRNCSITTKRLLGFIFDILGFDSSKLYKMIKDNKNYSFMTSNSSVFNAKWRIYVDKHFVKNK